eukprot:Amastigsp_a184268_5.p2 type:complete len:125 gc:universal Amastigsp_a184268_5:239-613(+)
MNGPTAERSADDGTGPTKSGAVTPRRSGRKMQQTHMDGSRSTGTTTKTVMKGKSELVRRGISQYKIPPAVKGKKMSPRNSPSVGDRAKYAMVMNSPCRTARIRKSHAPKRRMVPLQRRIERLSE